MSDMLNAITLLNNLLITSVNAMEGAAKVSAIINKRAAEGRDHWTEEEKNALDAELKAASDRAHNAVSKIP